MPDNKNNKQVKFEDAFLAVVIPSPEPIPPSTAGAGDVPFETVIREDDDDEELLDDSVLYYTKDELLDLQDEIDFLLDHFDSLQQQTSICWRGLEDAKKRKDFRYRYRNQVLDRHDELRKQCSSITSDDNNDDDDGDDGDDDDPVNRLQVFAVTLSMESQEEARKRATQDAEEALKIMKAPS